jgi:hypothetical protein
MEFLNAGILRTIPAALAQEQVIRQAFEIANYAGLSREEMEMQHKRHDFIRLQKGSLELAEKQGREQGMAQGENIGRQKSLLDILRLRLGEIPADLLAQIALLKAATIDELFPVALRVASWEEWRMELLEMSSQERP